MNATGRTSLRQLAALLERCRLCVGSDAGPMHIAAAWGVPPIGLCGPSHLHRFAPWGAQGPVLARGVPCDVDELGDSLHRCTLPGPRDAVRKA
jgi:ADP-heptose:LPS heptosyltransferase